MQMIVSYSAKAVSKKDESDLTGVKPGRASLFVMYRSGAGSSASAIRRQIPAPASDAVTAQVLPGSAALTAGFSVFMGEAGVVQLRQFVAVAEKIADEDLGGLRDARLFDGFRNGTYGARDDLLIRPGGPLDDRDGCFFRIVHQQLFPHLVDHPDRQEDRHGRPVGRKILEPFGFRHGCPSFETGADDGLGDVGQREFLFQTP